MNGGFFPAPEAIVIELGAGPAVLYGRIWRYCQGGGACYASIATLAAECNIGDRTAKRWISDLAAAWYITVDSGKGAGRTGRLATTRKWVMGGVGQDDPGVGQSDLGGRSSWPTRVGQNGPRLKDVEDKRLNDIAQSPAERHGGAQAPAAPEPMVKPARKPRAPKDQSDAQPIALLVDALGEARGYPIANFKRHVRAAKRLMELGHSPEDVRKTVAHIKREVRIMDGQPISMETVSKYIGIVCNKRGGGLHIGAAVAAPDWLVAE